MGSTNFRLHMRSFYITSSMLLFMIILICGNIWTGCSECQVGKSVFESDKYALYKVTCESGVMSSNSYVTLEKKSGRYYEVPRIAGWVVADDEYIYSPSLLGATYYPNGQYIEIIRSGNSFEFKYSVADSNLCLLEGMYYIEDTTYRVASLDTSLELYTLKPGKYYFTKPGFTYRDKVSFDSVVIYANVAEIEPE